MALLRRSGHDDDRPVAEEERDDRAGPAPGLVRALVTLVGLAAAGLLVWIASTFDLGSMGEFWVAMALIAAAGLVLGLSQLLGGWTKWGWPRFSPSVFLFAFLPTLVIAGGILLAMRPAGDETEQVRGWAEDIGISGLVEDFFEFPGLLAFAIGLVFAFCFDTSGPRTRIARRDDDVRDERVRERPRGVVAGAPERASVRDDYETSTTDRDRVDDRTGATAADRETASDRTVAEELHDRRERPDTVSGRSRDDGVNDRR